MAEKHYNSSWAFLDELKEVMNSYIGTMKLMIIYVYEGVNSANVKHHKCFPGVVVFKLPPGTLSWEERNLKVSSYLSQMCMATGNA